MNGVAVPMPRPFRRVAQFLNPAIRPLARRMPPLATLEHVGRRSGRTYETPVMAFGSGGRWTVALAYGSDVQWLRNIEHTGHAVLCRRGQRVAVQTPRRATWTEAATDLPIWARAIMRAARVEDYVFLAAVEPAESTHPEREPGDLH